MKIHWCWSFSWTLWHVFMNIWAPWSHVGYVIKHLITSEVRVLRIYNCNIVACYMLPELCFVCFLSHWLHLCLVWKWAFNQTKDFFRLVFISSHIPMNVLKLAVSLLAWGWFLRDFGHGLTLKQKGLSHVASHARKTQMTHIECWAQYLNRAKP